MRWIWAATGAMLAATAMAVGCSRGPDPKRIGVFAEAAGSPVEVTSYGVEELHESFSAGMWIEFKFEDPAKIPSLDGPVKAFYFNIPDAVVSESAVYALDSLGVKWRTNKKDRKPLAARLENISGTMYRLTEFEAAASKSRYLALLISMPRGTVDRLYAVRLQGGAGESGAAASREPEKPVDNETAARRTMGDIRSIATAVESYSVDMNRYPPSTGASMRKALAPGVGERIEGVSAYLSPTYIRKLPMTDGWGSYFIYSATELGSDYMIQSSGADGKLQTTPAKGETSDPGADLIFVNGAFVQYPKLPPK